MSELAGITLSASLVDRFPNISLEHGTLVLTNSYLDIQTNKIN